MITPDAVLEYLRTHGHPGAELLSLAPLGAEVQLGLKGHGYGQPLRAVFAEHGVEQSIVIRTMGADRYGHDRRADRIANATLSFDTFNDVQRHVRAIDVGAFGSGGRMISIAGGEPFLVTDYAEGDLYAKDLEEMAAMEIASPLDIERADALARYLAELHSVEASPERYRRSIRDTFGHGEGVMGLVDGYPDTDPIATPGRLAGIEHRMIDWRWRSRRWEDRSRRIHGDFHPFNLLFRSGTDFSVLDRSRGGAGDPADDVAALSINYYFFAVTHRPSFDGALREAWSVFWDRYLRATRDGRILEVIAPFFAWRALVLASPVWYPNVDPRIRDRILSFAEDLLAGKSFTPEHVEGRT
jgi:hypothetical protein